MYLTNFWSSVHFWWQVQCTSWLLCLGYLLWLFSSEKVTFVGSKHALECQYYGHRCRANFLSPVTSQEGPAKCFKATVRFGYQINFSGILFTPECTYNKYLHRIFSFLFYTVVYYDITISVFKSILWGFFVRVFMYLLQNPNAKQNYIM